MAVATPGRMLRWANGSGIRIGRDGLRCGRRGGRGWGFVRSGGGSGRRSQRVGPARLSPRRWAGCHQRSLHHPQGRFPGGIYRLPTARSLRSCVFKAAACARLPAAWAGRHPRSRVSCGAMRPRAAASWSIGPARRSGMPSGRHGARSLRSWPPTRCCGRMCRSGWPALLPLRAEPRRLGQRCPGRVSGMGHGRTGDGLWRGARSRLPNACGSTFRATAPCASATRPSTRRFMSRGGAR